jgi:hypothetical protein
MGMNVEIKFFGSRVRAIVKGRFENYTQGEVLADWRIAG